MIAMVTHAKWYMYVLVMSQHESVILVITGVRGKAEDEGNN